MATMDDRFYDSLEVRGAEEREAALLSALSGLVRHATENAPGLASHLAGVDPDTLTSFAALAALPVLHKSDLIERQRALPPFAGLNATPLERIAKVFASPGPIFEPELARADYWRFARAMYAAGFRPGDLVHNSFAYHLTPGGSMMESGARALGCPVIPAGTGQTDLQLQVIEHLQPAAFAGTPSFLRILLERGRVEGLRMDCFRHALVSGEAFPRNLADELQEQHGVGAYQCYATSDIGLIAYESEAREGMLIDEGVLVEVVRPGTGQPVSAGEVGEVVVTTFNPDYPLIRLATGDLSAIMPGMSPCGRTNRRLRGWLGRADQSTKVKGMFVHPAQVAKVAQRHGEVGRTRLVVERFEHHDQMTLFCEAEQQGDGLAAAIEDSLRAITGLRGSVTLVAPGALANDGKVIDDRRPLD
jgi:phenylacetate-CoA ligase